MTRDYRIAFIMILLSSASFTIGCIICSDNRSPRAVYVFNSHRREFDTAFGLIENSPNAASAQSAIDILSSHGVIQVLVWDRAKVFRLETIITDAYEGVGRGTDMSIIDTGKLLGNRRVWHYIDLGDGWFYIKYSDN
jgi:hypothetical protein